jgi:tetratricopeptide (TPR) repeat protein
MRKTPFLLSLMVWTATVATVAAQSNTTGSKPQGDVTEFEEYNPLQANKDIEVGNYYLKIGKYDAAIDRFEEAARLQPGLARPYLKLGETYEKKKDWPMAVASYKKYLDTYKSAPDAKSVQKKIADLQKRIVREAGAKDR